MLLALRQVTPTSHKAAENTARVIIAVSLRLMLVSDDTCMINGQQANESRAAKAACMTTRLSSLILLSIKDAPTSRLSNSGLHWVEKMIPRKVTVINSQAKAADS